MECVFPAAVLTIARLALFPDLDHHFVRYASDIDAFKSRNGTADPSAPIRELQKFLGGAAKISGGAARMIVNGPIVDPPVENRK